MLSLPHVIDKYDALHTSSVSQLWGLIVSWWIAKVDKAERWALSIYILLA